MFWSADLQFFPFLYSMTLLEENSRNVAAQQSDEMLLPWRQTHSAREVVNLNSAFLLKFEYQFQETNFSVLVIYQLYCCSVLYLGLNHEKQCLEISPFLKK